ncbi:MAG: shikimate dehydrogenase [Chitinophagaceae bacterium]
MIKRFGLIGFPLSHSFSKKYFTAKFLREGLDDYSYENFELEKISEFPSLLQDNPGIRGLNITIPYKEEVIRFLDEESGIVKTCKACNCIKISDGKLIGYNTDVYGFTTALSSYSLASHHKALVLGTGGASKAVKFSLDQLGIKYMMVSRSPSGPGAIDYSSITKALLEEYTLIINTTPLGTHPLSSEFPQIPYEFITARHYLFDLVYNPGKTKYLEFGEARGATIQNGLQMLELQAEESWRIWLEDDV